MLTVFNDRNSVDLRISKVTLHSNAVLQLRVAHGPRTLINAIRAQLIGKILGKNFYNEDFSRPENFFRPTLFQFKCESKVVHPINGIKFASTSKDIPEKGFIFL